MLALTNLTFIWEGELNGLAKKGSVSFLTLKVWPKPVRGTMEG
jgi:hypothetical protein